MDQSNQAVVLIGLIVQIILASVGIWYTLETRRLRQAGDKQISLLTKQARASLQPYLFPSIDLFNSTDIKAKIENDASLSDVEKKNKISELNRSTVKYTCSIANASSKVARDVRVWIYDTNTKSFLMAGQEIGVLSEKSGGKVYLGPSYYTADDVKKQIFDGFGAEASIIGSEIVLSSRSFCIIVYRDVEGAPYSTKRYFIHTGDVVRHLSDKPSGDDQAPSRKNN